MSEKPTKVDGNSSGTKRYGAGSGGNSRPELGRWIKITNSNSEIVQITHEEIFGNKFEDPMRRTPNIDKIIKFTGIKPSLGIEDMIKEIVAYKK